MRTRVQENLLGKIVNNKTFQSILGNTKLERRNGKFSNPSNFSDEPEVVAMRRLKIDRRDEPGQDVYPERQGEPDCIYFLRTRSCGYGINCRFNHPSNGGEVNDVNNTSEFPERTGKQDCGFYMKTGTCKYGSTCKYHHPKERHVDPIVDVNSLGLPMRQDSKPCPFYLRTGLCKYGYSCKYHHPQPETTENISTVSVYGFGSPGGSTVVPSSGASSVRELSAAPLSTPTYVHNPLFQVPQSYMPFYLPPSQVWNTYMGHLGPLSVTSILAASSNHQLSMSHLPERPDQPECRHFMNSGSCKYGSDCKYHHPPEKIFEFAANSIGPFGLPLRPGQPICSNYCLYGICKYGPTCRFDHPLDGYSYGYTSSVPSMPLYYSSSTSYQRIPSLVPSSETSPSKSLIKNGSNGNMNLHSNSKGLENLPDSSDSLPHSSKASPEPLQNESN